MSYISKDNGETWAEVTNLGWLLRNWEEVESFEVKSVTPKFHNTRTKALLDVPMVSLEYEKKHRECALIVYLENDRMFCTSWASHEMLLEWLDRSIFRDRPLNWFGLRTTVTKGQGK